MDAIKNLCRCCCGSKQRGGSPSSNDLGHFVQGNLTVIVHEAKNLPNLDTTSLTDAYVRVTVDERKGPRTQTVKDNLNPKFGDEVLTMALAGKTQRIVLVVKDEDLGGISETVGTVTIPFQDVHTTAIESRWYRIEGKSAEKSGAELCVTLLYEDAAVLTKETQVGESYFPERSHCNVTLYQDAHIESNSHLNSLFGVAPEEQHCAWRDLYCSIRDARHFIYITGWSVWTEVTLLREKGVGPEGVLLTLGNLLKQKAASGVKVLMLVWDEFLSLSNPIVNQLVAASRTGLMNTHDEETKNYFEGTGVVCHLVTRRGEGIDTSSAGNVARISQALGTVGAQALFTHHQKSVICDAALPGCETLSSDDPRRNERRIVAFVGGLDITSGRFDTPGHPLFSTLQTWHKNDFYQAYENFSQEFGPREPWHDIHCRLEGPIARDVMRNFELRWRRQVADKAHLLVDLAALPLHEQTDDSNTWHCQLFRSIDHTSAEFSESDKPVDDLSRRHPHLAAIQNMVKTLHFTRNPIDRSIYHAYLHQIRRAQRFIYIENQYFLGSSQEWKGFDEKQWNVECKHRIPIEITMKIISKIRRNEPFAVYVLIPMHPEGPGPEKPAVQAILYWQYKTVEMMYHKIHEALAEKGSTALATDYLNFYFLGNREPLMNAVGSNSVAADARQKRMCASRRAMIYVHSKMMIVDDEYIIVGSANINERSMAGDRDTEIAVGMYQPNFVSEDGTHSPKGKVARFRLSLWAEHTGITDPDLAIPNSLVCVHKLNEIALRNWNVFAGPKQEPMPSHLCKYPYIVTTQGDLQSAQACFPDMEPGGVIFGAPQNTIPNILTT